jgi:hypothetical protein
MGATYRIADEPTGSRFASLTVNPFWPLLAAMLAGAWLALPWYAVNGLAMGSATRRRELWWVGAGLAVSAALGGALFWAVDGGRIPLGSFRYLLVGLVAWRLTVAYALYSLQQSSFELHRYFGGSSRNGALLVVAGALAAPARLLGGQGAVLFAMLLG